MKGPIRVSVKCPSCGESLMDSNALIDYLPSIKLEATVADQVGHINLSQVYGSFNKAFSGVRDIEGSITEFACPHCHEPFPIQKTCSCDAPMVGLHMQVGGFLKFCTRNSCEEHSMEFENPEDMYLLFKYQDETGYA